MTRKQSKYMRKRKERQERIRLRNYMRRRIEEIERRKARGG